MPNKNKQTTEVFLCLGSNLGDRKTNINSALKLFEEKGIYIEKSSSFYLTEPVEVVNQPWFLNLVAKIIATLSAEELLKLCQQVEQELGRSNKSDKSPRIIDIDILLYGDKAIQKPDLQIPHPRMHLRRFMLEPLKEIAPSIKHPVFKKTISQLLKEVKDSSKIIELSQDKKIL